MSDKSYDCLQDTDVITQVKIVNIGLCKLYPDQEDGRNEIYITYATQEDLDKQTYLNPSPLPTKTISITQSCFNAIMIQMKRISKDIYKPLVTEDDYIRIQKGR